MTVLKLTYPQINAVYMVKALGLNFQGRAKVEYLQGNGIQIRVLRYLRDIGLLRISNDGTSRAYAILTELGERVAFEIRMAVEIARSEGEGTNRKVIQSITNKRIAHLPNKWGRLV